MESFPHPALFCLAASESVVLVGCEDEEWCKKILYDPVDYLLFFSKPQGILCLLVAIISSDMVF
jgi:hypothetical protein